VTSTWTYATAAAITCSTIATTAYATEQRYTYDGTVNTATLFTALAGNHVGAVTAPTVNGTGQYIAVTFLRDETSTERSNVQTIATGSPYNLTLSTTPTTSWAQEWIPLDVQCANQNCLEYVYDAGAFSSHVWQENAGENAATTAGQTVGQMDEASNGHYAQETNASRRPTLESDGAPEMHTRYNPTTLIQRMTVQNSLAAFAFVHQTGIFSVAVAVRPAVDSTTQYLMDNSTLCTGGAGFSIQKNSSNRIVACVHNGTSSVFSHTSNSGHTLVNADGQSLIVLSSTAGVHFTLQKVCPSGVTCNSWSETFAYTNAPSGTANAASNLTFGASASVTSGFNGAMFGAVIANGNGGGLNSGDLVSLAGWAPRESAYRNLRLDGRTLLNYCWKFYDFTDTTRLWTDSGRTTNVASNGDAIYWVDHRGDASTHLTRGMSQATSATRPLYEGSNGAQFSGAQWWTYADAAEPNGGAWTWGVIAFSNAAVSTTGSHVEAFPGGIYTAITGNTYASGGHRWINHFALGGSDLGVSDATHINDGTFFLIESHRNALTTFGRASRSSVTAASQPLSSGDTYSTTTVGNAGSTGWHMYGDQLFHFHYSVQMTATEFDRLICPWIVQHYGSLNLVGGSACTGDG
jgi:hypothetical protein